MVQRQPRGGIVLSFERHAHQLVQMLVLRLRNRVGIMQYTHPYEVDPATTGDFIIVLSRADLAGVIKVIKAKGGVVPLLVHIDTPETIAAMNYPALYPGMEIVAIPQDNLTSQPEETLSLTLFRDIMACLDQRASRV